MNEHCDSADSYNETDTCNKTCSYSNANNNNKIDSYSNADDNNKSSSRYEDTDTADKAATAGYIEELRQTTGSMCRFLRNLAAYRKNAAGTEKAMEAGKEPRKGSFASVVMIAAIAVLIVLIGLKAGAGMSGTLDKKGDTSCHVHRRRFNSCGKNIR